MSSSFIDRPEPVDNKLNGNVTMPYLREGQHETSYENSPGPVLVGSPVRYPSDGEGDHHGLHAS